MVADEVSEGVPRGGGPQLEEGPHRRGLRALQLGG